MSVLTSERFLNVMLVTGESQAYSDVHHRGFMTVINDEKEGSLTKRTKVIAGLFMGIALVVLIIWIFLNPSEANDFTFVMLSGGY